MLEKQKQALTTGQAADYSSEFYALLPFKKQHQISIKSKRTLYERFELCQLIKDIVSINEETNWNTRASTESKYRSIGAHIQKVDHQSSRFEEIKSAVLSDYLKDGQACPSILNIFEIARPNENVNYATHLSNHRQLFHGSKAANYLGILSRGLQLPKYVLDEHGIIQHRTDVGLLGAGIYFSDSARTSIKYSNRSCKNARFLLVCDVALGNVRKYFDHDYSLTKAPAGYHSVHGVKRDHSNESKFNDDEFVIYNSKQNRIRYLIELGLESEDGQVNGVLFDSLCFESLALDQKSVFSTSGPKD